MIRSIAAALLCLIWTSQSFKRLRELLQEEQGLPHGLQERSLWVARRWKQASLGGPGWDHNCQILEDLSRADSSLLPKDEIGNWSPWDQTALLRQISLSKPQTCLEEMDFLDSPSFLLPPPPKPNCL
ncbi:Hypothetical predicted protein [Podarcis lilfordi]|uniref:Uncharacterized protein n=1 Tax=Podarcis lilfordi TaxID=74358 RepID=A0AA35LEF3_9SAUR|nr:Hypothetical predicted protein [Podarcis lilfordi]